jgi:transposase InsO family protein
MSAQPALGYNTPMESFWGTLKTELIYHRKYTLRNQAETEIRQYIEIFYNRQRILKRLVSVHQLLLKESIFQK